MLGSGSYPQRTEVKDLGPKNGQWPNQNYKKILNTEKILDITIRPDTFPLSPSANPESHTDTNLPYWDAGVEIMGLERHTVSGPPTSGLARL